MEIANQLSLIGIRFEMAMLFAALTLSGFMIFFQVKKALEAHADGFLKVAPALAWTGGVALVTTLLAGHLVAIGTSLCALHVLTAIAIVKRDLTREAEMREEQRKAALPYWQAVWAHQDAQRVIEKAKRTYYPKVRKVERIS